MYRGIVLAAASVLVLSSCSPQESTPTPAPACPTRGTPVSEAYWPTVMNYSAISQTEHYEDVATMAGRSTVVVDAVVLDEMPTWTSARTKDGGPGVQHHGMRLEVRRVLRGELAAETGNRTIVENLGRVRDPLPRETLRGVFFLAQNAPGPLDPPGADRYYHLISSLAGRTFDDVVEQILSGRVPASPAAGSVSPRGCVPRGNP